MFSSDDLERFLSAASFAARAHARQVRKDGQTPYVSHVFRVCLIARQVFNVDDLEVLTTALVHDVLEDTPTDHDDLSERFGPRVADWAAQLSKDGRLPDSRREADYCEVLSHAPWQVRVCKLADMLDNLIDSAHLKDEARGRTFGRLRRYLDALAVNLPDEARPAWLLVKQRLDSVSTDHDAGVE